MSVSKLTNLIHEWGSELNENFKDQFYEGLESVEDEIADFEDELDDLRTENNTLNQKVYKLEDNIEDLESDIQDLKETSERYHESLEEELKEEWWDEVRKKYTLAQLESILGTRFNLKDI